MTFEIVEMEPSKGTREIVAPFLVKPSSAISKSFPHPGTLTDTVAGVARYLTVHCERSSEAIHVCARG
jgi:hypothetical protein